MNIYRYNEPLPKLKLDKKRFRVKHCPCGKSNKDGKFVPYVGYENKGYCHSCGETFLPELPKVEQWKKSVSVSIPLKSREQETPQKPVSFIPVEVFKKSLQVEKTITQVAEQNHFLKYLIDLFGVEVADRLRKMYFIGTSKHQFARKNFPNYQSEKGATVFWQIDTQGKVRTGKIMLYNPTTGKRQKEFTFAHKLIKQPEFGLKQCFFGEHLLIDKTKPVAIVESEKTAIIASVYLPQFIWVASSGLHGLNIDKCSVLKGRTVTLFPDLNGFDKWTSKATELSHLTTFTVSDLLERKAKEYAEKKGIDIDEVRKTGIDLADVLILHKANEFIHPEPEATEPPPAVQPMVEVNLFEQPDPVYYFSKPEQPKPESWEQDITGLENFFAGIVIPTQSVQLNNYSTITNCSLFIESHFATVKANNGKRTFLPYLNRLQELKQLFTIKSN